ncbi:DUF481 domain-containing protein [Haliea sp.]
MAHTFFPVARLTMALTALVAGLVVPGAAAAPDELVLKNGSRIFGTVKGIRDGVVTVETEFAGSLKIKQDRIVSLQSDGPVVLKLADGEVVTEPGLTVTGEQLVLTSGDAPAGSYALRDLALSDPEPWELGRGYRWTGQASAALGLQRGNTDTDEFDYRVDSVWRSLQDRYTTRLNGEIDEANGVKNAENWSVLAKYDRFLEGPLYWGVNVSAEQDNFADLDLRYYLGPYMGRQFYEQPVFTLSGEAGLVYVDEDFIMAEDQDYVGANWSVDASSNYLNGNSLLYLKHTGIWNLDETDNLVLNLVMGLSFPLLLNIEGAAEVQLTYDSAVPGELDELDQSYRFRIGYTW